VPPLTFVNSMALVLIEHDKLEEALKIIKDTRNARGKLNAMSVYLLMKIYYLNNDFENALKELKNAWQTG
jgi:ribosomal protein S21